MIRKLLLTSGVISASLYAIPTSHIETLNKVNNLKIDQEINDFQTKRTDRENAIKEQFDNINNASNQKEAASALIKRYVGPRNDMHFHKINKNIDSTTQRSYDIYSYEVVNHELNVYGSSVVAMAHGWYQWLRNQGYGMIDWENEFIHIPSTIPNLAKTTVISPYEKHIFGNQASVTYSQTYWNKYKWMDFSSWLVLHGYDLVFDHIGRESVYADFYKSLGFTDNEIQNFESGPAYSPFQQIGNVHNIHPNPYFFKYANKRKILNHNILNIFNKLDITPIAPGFSGLVPKSINKIEQYKNTKLVQTNWSEVSNYFIDPRESDILKIFEKKYIELYEKEYGSKDFYNVDGFNEISFDGMTKSILGNYANKFLTSVYNGIEEATRLHANGSSILVMQGWAFGYMRNNMDSMFDYSVYHEMVKDLPDDKFLVMDECIEYMVHKHGVDSQSSIYLRDHADLNAQAFDNKLWSYSLIPNFGANTGFSGFLKWYASAGPEALKRKNNGHLYAYGSSTEGIDNNSESHEIISEMGWRDTPIDFNEWIQKYCLSRYGFWNDKLKRYWDIRTSSVNGKYYSNIAWLIQGYPKLNPNNIEFFNELIEAFYLFAEIAQDIEASNPSPLFKDDLYFNAGYYESMDINRVLGVVHTYSSSSRIEWAKSQVAEALTKVDKILALHSTDRFSKWIRWAKQWGDTEEEKNYYAYDAKMILTWWMNQGLNNYAGKMWSGLISSYYAPKIQYVFDLSLDHNYHTADENTFLFDWLNRKMSDDEISSKPYENQYSMAISMLKHKPIALDSIPGTEKPGRGIIIALVTVFTLFGIAIITYKISKNKKK